MVQKSKYLKNWLPLGEIANLQHRLCFNPSYGTCRHESVWMRAPALGVYTAGSILCRLSASLSWRASAPCGCLWFASTPYPVLFYSCVILWHACAPVPCGRHFSDVRCVGVKDCCREGTCAHAPTKAASSCFSQPPQQRLSADVCIFTGLKNGILF